MGAEEILTTKTELEELYQLIGYEFTNPSFLMRAITTKSYAKEEYEQRDQQGKQKSPLEHFEVFTILGDAVLSLAIIDILREIGLDSKGDISQSKDRLVNQDIQSKMWKDFKIDIKNLNVTSGEVRLIQNYENNELIEGLFEGLIGAIFLDSDYPTAKDVVWSWYRERLEQLF